MGLKGRLPAVGFTLLLILTVGLLSSSARAALLYKSYIVKTAGDQEILCDPYIVQKDDYVLKIFRQRGEISNADFPEFLSLFEAINPHIQDVNKVLPGQRIFIPLKKLEPSSVPDQEFGVVTIPFVTNTDIDDILKEHGEAHVVRPGDSVSKLLSANFGQYGTNAYQEGLSVFKAMNPQIEDVNMIMVGQEVLLPKKNLRNELWYESLFDAYGNVAATAARSAEEKSAGEEAAAAAGQDSGAAGEAGADLPATPLADAAEVLGAKLYRKGTYYFPRADRGDLQLDLTRYPVIETRDGARALISFTDSGIRSLSDGELSVLKTFWKDLVVVNVPQDASLARMLDGIVGSLAGGAVSRKQTFDDGGVQVTVQPRWLVDRPGQNPSLAVSAIADPGEKTPGSVVDYLKGFGLEVREIILGEDGVSIEPAAREAVSYGQVPVLDTAIDRRAFVRNFFGAIGITYQENARVSFDYVGIQIQAVSNALNRADGLLVLVDFGDLQGEAVETLEKAGFQVLRVPAEGTVSAIIPTLLEAAGFECEADPAFTAARRSGEDNTVIALPGFLARMEEEPRVVLATVPVSDALVRFFKSEGIDVVTMMDGAGG